FVEAFPNGGFRFLSGGGASVSQRNNFTENVVVPLPAGAPLLAAGLLALGVLRRLRFGSAGYHQDPSLSDGVGRAQDAVGFRPPTPRTLVPVGLAALGAMRRQPPRCRHL
ncbi:MAG: VPLPA-CTERM sorting domain-containing protein, partial [Pseudomonadota bacterium]